MLVKTTSFQGKSHLVDSAKLTFRPAVYGIAIDGDTVLVTTIKDSNEYLWPGGAVELGEDHTDSLKREFREETGFEIEVLKPIKAYTSMFWETFKNEDFQAMMIFFFVKVVGGRRSQDGMDETEKSFIEGAEWIKVVDLEKMHYRNNLDIGGEIISAIKDKLQEEK